MHMHARRILAVVLFATAIASVGCRDQSNLGSPAAPGAVQSADRPPIFDERPYAEAKAAAVAERKWFIVKATAVWCGPCKQMDRTTWRDEKVVAWLTEHAIAVSVDVDQQKPLARELRIEAMPTIVAFRDDKEFDRIVGMRAPTDFLSWLEGLERGEKSIEAVARKAGSRDPSDGKVDVQARLQLARAQAQAGDLDKATEEFAWLWAHMLEHAPAMGGVRLSFMAGDMTRLAGRSPAAKTRFTELRDATRARLQGERVDWQDVGDFLALNEVIADPDASLAWFDSVKADSRWTRLLGMNMFRLRPLLVQQGRWADMGRLIGDAAAEFEQSWTLAADLRAPSGVDEAQMKAMRTMMLDRQRDEAAHAYASLLAADRDGDAAALARKATELDDSPDLVRRLIEIALRANEPRAEQLGMLAKAEAGQPNLAALRAELDAALAKVGTDAQ